MNHIDLGRITQILTYKRPHGSQGVEDLIRDIFAGYTYTTFQDELGADLALVITVGKSKTLFSCHLDTVHNSSGYQTVMWDEGIGIFYKEEVNVVPFKGKGAVPPVLQFGEPLGADDGAGIWLLLNMIDADVAGTYIFHFGEERGGVGSRGMAMFHDDWLAEFDRAIAFDRRDTDNIITHQMGGRCCSDEFGAALASALNAAQPAFTYQPDDSGVFTDTANYTDLIGECTNVSCGYDREHSPDETLDMEHLSMLRQACIEIKWEELPTVRKPGEVDEEEFKASATGLRSYWTDRYEEVPEDLTKMNYCQLEAWVEAQVLLKDTWKITEALWEALEANGNVRNYWEA